MQLESVKSRVEVDRTWMRLLHCRVFLFVQVDRSSAEGMQVA